MTHRTHALLARLGAAALFLVAASCGAGRHPSVAATAVPAVVYPCNASQLRASATLPTPGAGSAGVVFTFRNSSLTRCSVEGYPVLHLRGAQGRPLHTTTGHAGGTAEPVALNHRGIAFVYASWPLPRNSCEGPRAALVVIRLPRVRAPIDVPVGSASQAFTPCQGKIGVSPLEPR